MSHSNKVNQAQTGDASRRVCVVIPTYNNADRLGDVIEGVLRYCTSIIVVNDGSTDSTELVISKYPQISAILLGENRGKGCALRAGFHMARSRGYTHAITFDADGQHLPEDLPRLLDVIEEEPHTLWVGNRTKRTDGDRLSENARGGGKIGDLCFKLNTGITIHDIKCGLRAYPLQQLQTLKLSGERFEFEQDLLIRAAWNGTVVKELSVHSASGDKTARSHFHPVYDTLRIWRIHAKAGFIRVVFPVMSFEVPGENLREKISHLIKAEIRSHISPFKASFSLALGVFMGIFPIHGFQVITLMGLATLFRLNRPLSFLGVCISSPPLLPLVIVAAVGIGKCILPTSQMLLDSPVAGSAFVRGAAEFVVGSIVLAFICATATFFSVFPILRKISEYRLARERG